LAGGAKAEDTGGAKAKDTGRFLDTSRFVRERFAFALPVWLLSSGTTSPSGNTTSTELSGFKTNRIMIDYLLINETT
jgi:hypothetical protein